MRSLIIFLIVSTSLFASAKDKSKYAVKDIPEHMKKGMYAVVREESTHFEIFSTSKSVYKYRKVITILNDKANNYASFSVGYDKQSKVLDINAYVYNADGEQIKRLKAGDIKDQSAISGSTLFQDDRIKWADLSQAVYPYTVEYEYEILFNFLFFVPDFELYDDDEISIEKQSYIISYPPSLKPKFKPIDIDEPKKSMVDSREVLEWSFSQIVPEKFEKYSESNVPRLIAAPMDFEYAGYKGKMDSWENFGRWLSGLNQGRDVLPPSTKQKVHELTDHLTSTEEKIKILYEFLQNKTRYVSIQLGIGGYQPFEASIVDKTGYGDCKALSNYMVALLKEAGIKGYYSIVYGGRYPEKLSQDFAMNGFNHIIVAVPHQQDTIWLECTSQTQPFGFLGSFTADRHALMITDDGGKLVKTPRYSLGNNTERRTATVTLDISGNAQAKVTTVFEGLKYEYRSLDNSFGSPEQQKKWIQSTTQIPSFELKSYTMKNGKEKWPFAEVSMDLDLKRYASVSGKRVFITPNLMNRSTFIPEKTEKRKYPIVEVMNSTELDSIRFQVPDILYPEFLPETIKISSQFGNYEASFTVDQGSLVYIRKLTLFKGTFPADAYLEFSDFYRNINKADNTKIVFLNKT